MKMVLGYGHDKIDLGGIFSSIIKERRLLEINRRKIPSPLRNIDRKLKKALIQPLGIISPLPELIKKSPHKSITIVIDDHTRSNQHTRILLPLLLHELQQMNINQEYIHILIASGTHRPPSDDQLKEIVGEKIYHDWKHRIISHDCDDNLFIAGYMEDGTPIELNNLVRDSGVIILLTDGEPHYFAGFAGGPKSLIPGICGRKITTSEHLLMFNPEGGFAEGVAQGLIDNNAVYKYKKKAVDILEKELAKSGTYIYNIMTVIVGGEIVYLEGGNVLGTHLNCLDTVDAVYGGEIEKPADVVIISAAHLGINLYQACKAFTSAVDAVKPGGRILALAPCYEGFGNDAFRDLMKISADIFKDKLARDEKITEQTIKGALLAIQEIVMRNFVIGMQKPVALLVILKHVGWKHIYMLQEGLTGAEQALLPFMDFLPISYKQNPGDVISDWIGSLEAESSGKYNYCLIDDPGRLVRITGRKLYNPDNIFATQEI